MAIPTWVPGEILASSDVNTWFVPKAVTKPSDTGRSSTTAMTNDPDIVLPLGSNSTYAIQGVIFYDGPTAGASDLKFTFTVPSGSNGQYFAGHQNLSGAFAGAFQSNWTDTLTANTNGTGTIMCVAIQGTSTTGGAAGNLTLQWAQNTSNGTATHVKAQTYLYAVRIA